MSLTIIISFEWHMIGNSLSIQVNNFSLIRIIIFGSLFIWPRTWDIFFGMTYYKVGHWAIDLLSIKMNNDVWDDSIGSIWQNTTTHISPRIPCYVTWQTLCPMLVSSGFAFPLTYQNPIKTAGDCSTCKATKVP